MKSVIGVIVTIVVACFGLTIIYGDKEPGLFAKESQFEGEYTLEGLIEVAETGSGSKTDVMIFVIENMMPKQTDTEVDPRSMYDMGSFVRGFADHTLSVHLELIQYLEQIKQSGRQDFSEMTDAEIAELESIESRFARATIILDVLEKREEQVYAEIKGKQISILD